MNINFVFSVLLCLVPHLNNTHLSVIAARNVVENLARAVPSLSSEYGVCLLTILSVCVCLTQKYGNIANTIVDNPLQILHLKYCLLHAW